MNPVETLSRAIPMPLFGEVILGKPDWLVPVSIVGVVFLVLVAVSYRVARFLTWNQKLLPSVLKILAIAGLLFCLVEPLYRGERPRPGANVFAIVVDKSKSMDLVSKDASQIKKLLKAETPWQTRVSQDFDVRRYEFDSQIQNVDNFAGLTFDGDASSIGNSIDTIAKRFHNRPTAGILLFSDGIDTSSEDVQLTEKMKAYGIPIFPVLPQDLKSDKDIRVGPIQVSQTNFEAAPSTVQAEVHARGVSGQDIVGRIANEKGDVVQSETLTAQSDDDRLNFRFQFRPEEIGLSFYDFQTFLASENSAIEKGKSNSEQTIQNNSRTVAIDRGGGPYKILYVSGRPNWEFKFLRRALSEDVEVDLDALIRIAKKEPKFSFRDQRTIGDTNRLFQGFDNQDEQDTESYQQPVLLRLGIDREEELRDGFPKAAPELFVYDAIILDDIEASFFTADQMALVRRFVNERGGGFLMLGGLESFAGGKFDQTPIGEMLPVYATNKNEKGEPSDNYRWNLTLEGTLQPWIRLRSTSAAQQKMESELPTFKTLNRVDGLKPGAFQLAKTPNNEPVFASQRFGKGRTAALMLGDMWRWTMHRKQGEDSDLSQLWRQTIRWLVSDVPKRIDVDTGRFSPNQPMEIKAQIRDEEFKPLDNASVTFSITTPSGANVEATARPTEKTGEYMIRYSPKEDGGYRFSVRASASDGSEIGQRETGLTATPKAAEYQILEPSTDWLEELASQTGGETLRMNELERFANALPNRKVPITETWVYPLWHRPFILGLIIVCLSGEWGLRRWKGLP